MSNQLKVRSKTEVDYLFSTKNKYTKEELMDLLEKNTILYFEGKEGILVIRSSEIESITYKEGIEEGQEI